VKSTSEDKRLIDYLLGNLPEPDQVRLEEAYLADTDTQERLLVIEDDLVDAYLQGELSSLERKRLEAGFLASPRGQKKLALARSLMTLASEQKSAPASRSFPAFPVRWAFAAAAMIFVLVLAWFIRQQVWQRSGNERAGSQTTPNGQGVSGQAAQAGKTPFPAESPQLPAIASIILKPVGRNIERSPRLKIPYGALKAKIQLDLEADIHKSYKVSLLGAGDNVRWSSRGLKSQATASGRAIVLTLPVKFFDNGEHALVLTPDEDSARPIAEYVFVVQKS